MPESGEVTAWCHSCARSRVKIEKRREVPQDLLDRVRILCENGANAKPAPAPALPKPAAPARARRA